MTVHIYDVVDKNSLECRFYYTNYNSDFFGFFDLFFLSDFDFFSDLLLFDVFCFVGFDSFFCFFGFGFSSTSISSSNSVASFSYSPSISPSYSTNSSFSSNSDRLGSKPNPLHLFFIVFAYQLHFRVQKYQTLQMRLPK